MVLGRSASALDAVGDGLLSTGGPDSVYQHVPTGRMRMVERGQRTKLLGQRQPEIILFRQHKIVEGGDALEGDPLADIDKVRAVMKGADVLQSPTHIANPSVRKGKAARLRSWPGLPAYSCAGASSSPARRFIPAYASATAAFSARIRAISSR